MGFNSGFKGLIRCSNSIHQTMSFNSWRLLYASDISCSSSGLLFVHAALYVTFSRVYASSLEDIQIIRSSPASFVFFWFYCVSLCITVYHCVSLCITVYHCVSLCITVYHCVSLYTWLYVLYASI